MVPRIGAFEISFVVAQEGTFEYKISADEAGRIDVLLFSKFVGGIWPHYESVAERLGKLTAQIPGKETIKFATPFDFSPFQFNPTALKVASVVKKPKSSQGAKI